MASTLVAWVEEGNDDPVPFAKLPTSRFVPTSVGVDDGSGISALNGEWVVGAPSGDGTSIITPAEYERIGGPVSYGTDNQANVPSTDWRDYEWLACVFKRTQDSVDYPFAFLTHLLDQEGEIEVPLEQNARIQIFAVANSDSIGFGNLSGITGSPANSDTIEVWGYKPPHETPAAVGNAESQDPTVWRIEYVRSDDIPGQPGGKVYIRLRYLDTFDPDTGNRTGVVDTGSGYLTATGGRTISLNVALDIRALLAQASLAALMTLITTVPAPGDAAWGEWYGHTDADGRVLGVYYRREQETTEMDWWAERLSSTNRNLHGYAQVSRSTYQKGGALYPTNEGIEELIEEEDANGNVTVRAIINDGGLLHSGISIIMFWANEDGEFSSAREMPLFHDASYTQAGQRRYVSSLGTEFTFTAGHRYRLHWRNAGQGHDLILNVAQHMVQLADHDHIADLRAEAFEEIYQVEDRVAVLESGGGGGPTTQGAEVSVTVATANAWVDTGIVIPSQDYFWIERYLGAEGGALNMYAKLTFERVSPAVAGHTANAATRIRGDSFGGVHYNWGRTAAGNLLLSSSLVLDDHKVRVWT